MPVWLLLLLLLPPPLGAAPKAWLLLQPPWLPTFQGETVNLTCKGPQPPAQGGTSWYRDKDLLPENAETRQTKVPGCYQCKTHGSSLSDPVCVQFLSDWLVLQAKHPVFEGDNVTLRCQGKDKEAKEKSYYKNKKKLDVPPNSHTITAYSFSRDSDVYHCTSKAHSIWRFTETSNHLKIQVQELFPPPVLTVSPSQPMEGSPVTLTCETQLPPQRPDVRLQFCFFREGHILGSGCSSSPELQIPAIWNEDARSYRCQAQTVTRNVMKSSLWSSISVQRVPVSDVNLEVQPRGGKLMAGENLVLICSVAKGTGTVTFSWYRDGTKISLGRKIKRSQSAELQVPSVKTQDGGTYRCSAYNMFSVVFSRRVNVTLAVPVSQPVLTLRTPRAQAVVGDTAELHCEAQRGSPPILYRFYHDDVALGNSSAPSGGGTSFSLSLTAEHSGNYSCDADNGLGAQHSDRTILSVTVPASRPILILRTPRTQPMVGDMVELHCEAQTGSPPILYRFYHNHVTLGNNSAPSGGSMSFNLSLTAEHSGNYSCEADNGLGAQRSEEVPLDITGPSRSKATPAAGVVGGLLIILGLAAVTAWVSRLRAQRNSGGLPATGTPSHSSSASHGHSLARPSSSRARELPRSEPALTELQPVYSNVDPGHGNLIYSEVWSIQHTERNLASSPRMHQDNKEPVVIYSELKKGHPDDWVGQDSSGGRAHEDAADNYENVPCAHQP